MKNKTKGEWKEEEQRKTKGGHAIANRFPSLTLRICSLISLNSSKLCLLTIENTITKACEFFMYYKSER